jgi:hypothetical protein
LSCKIRENLFNRYIFKKCVYNLEKMTVSWGGAIGVLSGLPGIGILDGGVGKVTFRKR